MVVVEFPRELSERPFDGTPIYNAEDLTRSGDLAHIVLNGQTYTLRITKAGKLILTK
ncbi:MAG: hemin uptake protein HemP [Rhodobacteraceae bacterium]|nr:hemin uptake protein HemP [Paracoccaceae bacterium]